jgi:hypothetical protein
MCVFKEYHRQHYLNGDEVDATFIRLYIIRIPPPLDSAFTRGGAPGTQIRRDCNIEVGYIENEML